MNNDRVIKIAKVTGAQGIKGLLRIDSYCDDIELFKRASEIILKSSDGLESSLEIKGVRKQGKHTLLDINGIDDRNRAEKLIGSTLYCRKDILPPLEEGEYYWVDLIGIDVYSVEDIFLGSLSSIMPTPGNDVFVIRHNEKEILIPAIASVIQDVDLNKNRMFVKLLEGIGE